MDIKQEGMGVDRRTLLMGRPRAVSGAQGAFDPVAAERASRRALLARMAPDVPLLTEEGRTVFFYRDVLQDQRVVFSAMYGACQRACPPSMRHLMAARELLGPQAGGLRFVTMTLTPLDDGPAQLRAYKERYGMDADWRLLTGAPAHVEAVQAALGYAARRPGEGPLTHVSMVRVCDERRSRWGHVQALSSPRNIARMIRFELV